MPLPLQQVRPTTRRPLLRTSRRPVRLSRGGGFVGTVTFPSTLLVTRVRIALGADLSADPLTWPWQDITDKVRHDLGISLQTGRRENSGSVQTGSAVLKLDNRDGRFSRRNPTGPYYGLLSKNTPIWVTVDAGSGEKTRLEMFVNDWPTRWSDKSVTDSTVTIQCAGILRRLSQGKVIKSALRRSVQSAGPVEYWPLEDGTETAIVGSAVAGGTSLAIHGTVDFATASGPDGSLSLPSAMLDLGGELAGTVTPSSTTSWGLSFVIEFPPDAYPTAAVIGAIATWTVPGHSLFVKFRLETLFGEGFGFGLTGVAADGSEFTLLGSGDSSAISRDVYHHLFIWSEQSGSNIVSTMYFDGVQVNQDTRAGTNGTTGIGGLTISPMAEEIATGYTAANVSIGHWAVYDDTIADTAANVAADQALAMNGYVGEMAHDRMTRVCAQEGVLFATLASSSPTMGPQGVASLIEVLREAEATGGGVLYEKRWGLAYQSLGERYNAAVGMALDFDQGHIAELPEPADDDERTRNLWTASRPDGSEYTAEQTTGPMGTGAQGPGTYDDSVSVNTETDGQLASQAGWRVHLGTIDEDRWPGLALNFARNPTLIDTWTALAYGSRVTVANPMSQMPPDQLDQIIEGHNESWNGFVWRAGLNLSPFSPYRVNTVASSSGNLGRVDSADSTLFADVDSTTTSLTVDGTLPWSTSDSGYDVGIGGEQVTVSSVASIAAETFGHAEVNGWGTGESGGAWLTNGGVAGDYSISSGTGRHAPTAAASTRITHQQLNLADTRSLLDVRAPAVATGAEIRMGRVLRYTSASNFYHVLLCWQTDSTVDLTIWSRINLTDTELSRAESLGTYASGDWWRILVDIRATTIRAMAWSTSATKPQSWQLTQTDTNLSAVGSVGCRTFLAAGNSNTLPLTCEYDNNDVQTPQTFTVVRSVNGVVKAQATSVGGFATRVSLWHPGVVAL